MKSLPCCILVCFSFMLAPAAHAQWDVGMGAGVHRDSVFGDGLVSVFADYSYPIGHHFSSRFGVDYSYATHPYDGYDPDLTYKAIGGRASVLWHVNEIEITRSGFYVGAGPSLLHYTLTRETPGSSGSTTIKFRGTGGISNLWALLLNQLGSNSYVPARSVSDTKTAFGGHAFIGYQRKNWRIEALYEAAASDLIRPGSAQVRFSYSFK